MPKHIIDHLKLIDVDKNKGLHTLLGPVLIDPAVNGLFKHHAAVKAGKRIVLGNNMGNTGVYHGTSKLKPCLEIPGLLILI